MASVTLRDENRTMTDPAEISAFLAPFGIWYRRFEGTDALGENPTDQEILDAYKEPIEILKEEGGYVTADVINIKPETPNLQVMLDKFNKEHWHDEDEVRFIVHGNGLFHPPARRPGVRHRGHQGRHDPGAEGDAPLVRPLRRPEDPRRAPVPGHVGLDAALHVDRRGPAVSAALLRAVLHPVGRHGHVIVRAAA